MDDYMTYLKPIVDEFKDGDTTPLTKEEVSKLCFIIEAKINLVEGNLTQEEYEFCLDTSTIM